MTIAFYAPLKEPGHPTPSGDRAMARALMAALEYAGATVKLASTLRTRDGQGDPAQQSTIVTAAAGEAANVIATGQREGWCAWITYHNYYKAPDLLGPTVCAALDIPYIQIESTRAQKRLTGPWSRFAQAAEAASDAADMIFYLTQRDAFALERDAPAGQRLHHLAPFLPIETLPANSHGAGPILAVGMMRAGDKYASYHLIADTLAVLDDLDWQLEIAGDGPARADVAALFAPFGGRVSFLGALPARDLAAAYQRAALLFWPGVNEAFGLSYLEAQAHGLPVIAQDRPGVCDVLAPGVYPDPDQGATTLATTLRDLLGDPHKRRAQGQHARAHVAAHHLLPAAATTLRQGLAELGVT